VAKATTVASKFSNSISFQKFSDVASALYSTSCGTCSDISTTGIYVMRNQNLVIVLSTSPQPTIRTFILLALLNSPFLPTKV